MGDDRNDQFDDLFEPFELEDIEHIQATTGEHPATPPAPAGSDSIDKAVPHAHVTADNEPVATINCPACGAANPTFNHHCERCGARLSTDPMPIAPAPAGRSTPGVRALGVLAAVVLVVALFALIMNIFRSGDSGEVVGSETTTSSTSTTAPVIVEEVFPTSVRASSTLSNSDRFAPENLIDGDPETRWNDNSLRGEGAWLEFTFSPPVALTEMVIQNVSDDDKFDQNYKVQGYIISTNDLSVDIPGRLINSNEPQRINIASLETITLRLEVTTTYPAESVGDAPPYDELALEDVRFFGVQG